MIDQVYRDRWLLVVDKPSGMPSQPDPSGDDDVYTALTRIETYVGLHHRLDRPTSGLLVVAIDPAANAPLADAFRRHAVHRTYAAVLAGAWPTGTDTLTWDHAVDGRPARTTARSAGSAGGLVAAWLTPETGRTHQLRIHAAMAGLPIVGDRRHGGAVGGWLPRLALHAAELRLDHPVTGEALAFRAPLPADLRAAWQAAGGEVDPVDG